MVARREAAGISRIARLQNARIASIDKLARRMVRKMSKLCPIWATSAVLEKSEGPCECIEDKCQMWCPEIEEVYSHKQNKHFRAGCGLMPKENREFSP